jgi:methionine-rich copper-binding protein CopC
MNIAIVAYKITRQQETSAATKTIHTASRERKGLRGNRRLLFYLTTLLLLLPLTLPPTLRAQTFQSVPPIVFTKTVNSTSNPLPQVITVASTGTAFNFYASVVNGTGGSWLTQNTNSSYSQETPFGLTLTANPDVSLAAGTYTAQLSLKPSGSSTATIVPATLIVEPASATFFDELPGGLDFSMVAKGNTPPGQTLSIRNAGAGTLAWSATTSTADGGNWIKLSAASGTAPSAPIVSITPASLPESGQVVGTFTGQVLLKTGSDSVTIPITVIVGDTGGNPVFEQLQPVSFTKTVNSTSEPLSQVINVSGTGSSFDFYAVAIQGTGGSWLSQSTNSSYAQGTSHAITLTADPVDNLAAGVYTAQVLLTSLGGHEVQVIPVTLTVEPASSTYFDELPGELTFSMVASGVAPPTQLLPMRNAGTGTLNWSATVSTSDGGGWLTFSPLSGTAPSVPSVGINPAKLPQSGQVVGTFTGQVLLTSGTDSVTIPVTVAVGDAGSNPVFQQLNPVNFTKTVNSTSEPLSQVITVASTGNSFNFYASVISGTGGNWLSQSTNSSYSQATPYAITLTANPATTLAAGTYTAEVLLTAYGGGESMIVPVTLTVESNTVSYFDELPGELTFSMVTSGTAPPSQLVQIRNAGSGSLSFTVSVSTSDGGKWLTASAASGTAPYLLSIGVNPSALPQSGQVVGTFTGQILLTSGTGSVTIPVSVSVGDTASNPVFRQLNPISFVKAVDSTSQPLPQIITVPSSGDSFNFYASVINGTGGNWLTQSTNSSYAQATPYVITLAANPATTLAAGTYTAEVLLTSSGDHESQVIPVTLTVAPGNTAYFDELPGGLTFSSQPTGVAIPSQPLLIRNAGTGALNWAATTSTADGGKWLTLNSYSGLAPSSPSVSIVPANLPNAGKVAGTFTGQILLQSASGMVTVPVTVTLGDSVFVQAPGLSFTINQGGAAPASQSLPVASTDTNFAFYASAINGTGGNWLSQSTNSSYEQQTPYTMTVNATPAANLAAGVYTSQIYLLSSTGAESSVVPVTLTVSSSTATPVPTFNPPGGSYSSNQSISLADTNGDAVIYYTTDGSTPTTSSARYSKPLLVTATQTVKAIAISPAFAQSAVASATYTITAPVADTPAAASTITISEATSGVTVYYTTNGTTPTSASAVYTGPIMLNANSVLKFIAIGPNYTSSTVRTVTTTIQ